MSIIALLLGILIPALGKARAAAILQKDATKMKKIHSAWIQWSADDDGRYPTPGLVNRLANSSGQHIKGVGPEDRLANTTDNLHSLAIMENLYKAEDLICDNEPNSNIYVFESYDYDVRSVPDDIYWDEDLNVDMQEGGEGSNISYASIPLIGQRKIDEWKNSSSSNFPIISNRGPEFGQPVKWSLTFDIHGGGRDWAGNICWQDNHTSYEETFLPTGSVYETFEGKTNDNIFNIDCVTGICNFWGGDTWLIQVSELTEVGTQFPYQLNPELQWDPQIDDDAP
jgi:hypothetical protein